MLLVSVSMYAHATRSTYTISNACDACDTLQVNNLHRVKPRVTSALCNLFMFITFSKHMDDTLGAGIPHGFLFNPGWLAADITMRKLCCEVCGQHAVKIIECITAEDVNLSDHLEATPAATASQHSQPPQPPVPSPAASTASSSQGHPVADKQVLLKLQRGSGVLVDESLLPPVVKKVPGFTLEDMFFIVSLLNRTLDHALIALNPLVIT